MKCVSEKQSRSIAPLGDGERGPPTRSADALSQRASDIGVPPRGPGGRFGLGNPGGPGNPYARRVAGIRAALLAAVSDEDIRAIVAALVKKAKEGDVVAAREVLDRCLGRPVEADLIVRLEAIESHLASKVGR